MLKNNIESEEEYGLKLVNELEQDLGKDDESDD